MANGHALTTGSKLATLLAAFFIHFVTHGIVYSFGVLFIALDSLFPGSKAEIAWIGSIATAMIFLGGPVTGYLTAKFGCRYVSLAGALVGFLGYGISLFVSNLYLLYVTMGFVAGSGFGLLYLPAIIAVTQAFSKYRTVACGLSLCGAGIGAFVFSPLQRILLEEYAWQGTILINAGIILNCAPFALLLLGKQTDEKVTAHRPEKDSKDKPKKLKDVEESLLHGNGIDESFQLGPCSKQSDGFQQRTDAICENKNTSIKNDKIFLGDSDGLLSEDMVNTQICSDSKIYWTDGTNKDNEVIIEAGKSPKKKVSFTDNIDILKEPLFLLFTSSQFLFFVGLYLPFMYIPDRAKNIGITETRTVWLGSTKGIMASPAVKFSFTDSLSVQSIAEKIAVWIVSIIVISSITSRIAEKSAVWIVSTIGISSITSRIVLGYAVDRLSIDRSKFIAFTLLVGGVSTALGPVFTSLWMLLLYAAVYGVCLGVSISFISVVLVDLLGLARINEAFGMNNLFTGIAVLLGPPFAGFLFDMTGNYDATFVVAGVSQALAGILMFFTPLLKKGH